MFSQSQIDKVVKEDKVVREVFTQLLNVHVAPLDDWWGHVIKFLDNAKAKLGDEKAKELTRNALAFTILIPSFDNAIKVNRENPQRLFYGSVKFDNFNERDWFSDLKKLIKQDQQISANREKVISLGVIDPIDYQPYTKQAFKWLCEKAEEEGVLTPNVKDKLRKLVSVYGGWIITYIFTKHEPSLSKVTSWSTGYFFEKVIYEVYNLDQIIKIKQSELNKTNDNWVKSVNMRSAD